MSPRKSLQTRRVTTISLPESLYRNTVKLARAKGMNTSELIRDALRVYERLDRDSEELQEYGRRKAAAAGIRTEEDVERLMDEIRS